MSAADLIVNPLSLDQLASRGRPYELLRRLIQLLAGAPAAAGTPDPKEPANPREGREEEAQSVSKHRRSAMKTTFALVLGLATLAGTTSFAPARGANPDTPSQSPCTGPNCSHPVRAHAPLGGPKLLSGDIEAFSSASVKIYLRAGEASVITMIGDGDTDTDLFVFDELGNLIASDLGLIDRAQLIVTPRWTGEFTIVVRNRGPVFNHVVLTVE